MMHKKIGTILLGLLAFAAVAPGLRAQAQKLRNHFDNDALLQPPAFFDFVVLGTPAQASWKVLTSKNSPSLQNYVSQVVRVRPPDSIAVAVRRNAQFADGTWSVAMLRGQGHGGILFRMADEKNFRLLLVNMGSGEAHLVAYENGAPAELAHGQVKPDREWNFLEIVAKGPHIVARVNEQPLLEAVDPRPVSGKAGLATAGSGTASFDEFILDPGGN
jgi:3-keto-disaccharide hydrolase